MDIKDKQRPHDLAGLVLDMLETYNCKSKLVAKCYDGMPVMASELKGVQAHVKDEVPHGLFVHCHADTLNLVMLRGASKI